MFSRMSTLIVGALLVLFVPPAAHATAQGGIQLAKTVGTDPAACAATGFITVTAGTTVVYCYNVTNTGAITYTTHDLTDSELGMILSGFPRLLVPSASTFVTATTRLNQPGTITNVAIWTASITGTLPTSATASATVDVLPGTEDGGAGPAGCSDGIDNDGDGLIDCGDPDCLGIPPCIAPAPALGSGGLIVTALMLLGVGGAALTVRRRGA